MSLMQLWSILAAGVMMKIGLVALLVLSGMPVVVLLTGGYAVAIVCMLGMQRRARESCDSRYYLQHHLNDARVFRSASGNPFGASADASVGVSCLLPHTGHMHA